MQHQDVLGSAGRLSDTGFEFSLRNCILFACVPHESRAPSDMGGEMAASQSEINRRSPNTMIESWQPDFVILVPYCYYSCTTARSYQTHGETVHPSFFILAVQGDCMAGNIDWGLEETSFQKLSPSVQQAPTHLDIFRRKRSRDTLLHWNAMLWDGDRQKLEEASHSQRPDVMSHAWRWASMDRFVQAVLASMCAVGMWIVMWMLEPSSLDGKILAGGAR